MYRQLIWVPAGLALGLSGCSSNCCDCDVDQHRTSHEVEYRTASDVSPCGDVQSSSVTRTTSADTYREYDGVERSSSANRDYDRTRRATETRGEPGNVNRTNDRNRASQRGEDQTFLREAAMGNDMEVEMGRTALQKSNNDDVRRFAQRLIDDHSNAQSKLRPIAQQASVDIPGRMSEHHADMIANLKKLDGSEFDRQFIDSMVKDHKEDIRKFEKESTDGKNPEARDFALNTLPALREHLRMAEKIQSKLNDSGNDRGSMNDRNSPTERDNSTDRNTP